MPPPPVPVKFRAGSMSSYWQLVGAQARQAARPESRLEPGFPPSGRRVTTVPLGITVENLMTANKTSVIAVATLVSVGLGYWAYGSHQKRETQQMTVALIADIADRLRQSLIAEAASPPASRTRRMSTLDDEAAAADKGLKTLKAMHASGNQALVDAADDYLITSREILKKLADVNRYRARLEGSSQALHEHMRSRSRSGAWVQDAVQARERVNQDLRAYTTAAEVSGKLLESFAASQKRIAPFVGKETLIAEDIVAKASARVAKNLQQTTAEMEKTRLPDAFR